MGDVQKSTEIAEEILPQMTETFGAAGHETLSLMTTLADDYRMLQRYDDCRKLLEDKTAVVQEFYADNPLVKAKTILEFADLCFAVDDADNANRLLNAVMSFADAREVESNFFITRRLYEDVNATAERHLSENHPAILKSKFGLMYAGSAGFGETPQAITFYEQNLPTFKKIFGEDNDETLDMMNALSDDCLSLGRYADAEKFAKERLNICRKHFGRRAKRTITAAIDLAEIYYRTGKYKTADKILAVVEAENSELFAARPAPSFAFRLNFTKAEGARMRGDFGNFSRCLNEIENLFKNDGKDPRDLSNHNSVRLVLETSTQAAMLDVANDTDNLSLFIMNLSNIVGLGHAPAVLKLMNDRAESYVAYGQFRNAERYAERVLRLSRVHLGKGNFYEWMALNTLGKVRRAEGNADAALKFDEQALQIAESVCGVKSLERLQSLDAIASDNAALGNVH